MQTNASAMKKSLPPLLCVGFPAWEGDYQKSTVQLMQALAQHAKVLYVEYPFSWKDVYQGLRHGKKPARRILGLDARLRKMAQHETGSLHVLTLPPVLPINGFHAGKLYDFFARYHARRAAKAISQALRQLGFVRPVMINAFNPFLGVYLHGQLPVIREYYYCYDQIGAARWTDRHGPRLETRFLRMVDGLITSSLPLLEEKLLPGMRGVVVKNGVNLPLFEQAFRPEPRSAAAPVLGYLGSLDERIDFDLLLGVLQDWPDARLLLVGRIGGQELRERLMAHPRVEVTGGLQPEELPDWVKKMDLGLIPFVKNEFTRFIYPLKINEYLAAGLPVVSTSFSDLSDFAEMIEQADAPDSFWAACRRALEQDSPAARIARRTFAEGQSWEARATELVQWIQEDLPKDFL